MRRLISVSVLLLGLSAIGAAEDFQGVLADWNCVEAMVKRGRETVLKEQRNCSLMENVTRSAYGLITDDKKSYRLDDPGNRRVLELLRNSPDKDNLKVLVSGQVKGNTIKVSNMSIL
jgi:hypothetical protein